MNILGIESSGLTASVGIVSDKVTKAEFSVGNKLTHSETLLPMVRDMFEISRIRPEEIDAIAVSSGPGSFTGLRIGVSTAKGLAVALNIPVIKIGSLEAMGLPLSFISDSIICPCMDARHMQVYSAAYFKKGKVIKEDARDIRTFLGEVKDYILSLDIVGRKAFSISFPGDGATVYEKNILDICSEMALKLKICGIFMDIHTVPAPFNRQRASSLAFLGDKYYDQWLLKNGMSAEEAKKLGANKIKCFDEIVMNSDDLVPIYLRKSQAEQNAERNRKAFRK